MKLSLDELTKTPHLGYLYIGPVNNNELFKKFYQLQLLQIESNMR